MAVYFTGGDPSCFFSNNATRSTTGGKFASPALSSMSVAADGFLKTPTIAPGTSVWLHFEVVVTGQATRDTVVFYDIGGVALLAFGAGGGLKTQSGGLLYAPFITSNGTYRYDINFDTSAGLVRLFRDEQQIFSVQLASTSSVAWVSFFSAGTTTDYSQIIVASESTVSWKLAELPVSGAGNQISWTGSYLDVTEQPADLSTVLSTMVSGSVETWTHTTLPEYNIVAVTMVAQARKASSAPNVQAVSRIGSTNYAASFTALPTLSFAPVVAIFPRNPATNTAWTSATINSAEFGVKSV